MELLDRGKLITTEPTLNRALAAEIRFDPDSALTFLREILGASTALGTFVKVTCESTAHAKVDILIELSHATVGLETKVGHRLTREQYMAEKETLDHLIVVTKDPRDVHGLDLPGDVAVVTWAQWLGRFSNSRIDISDVNDLNDLKRLARSDLGRVDLGELLDRGAGWEFTQGVGEGGGGFTALDFCSPVIPWAEERRVCGQVEMTRGSKNAPKYTINFGVSVRPEDFDEPAAKPEWLTAVERLGAALDEQLRSTAFPLRTTAGSHNGRGLAKKKIDQARRFGVPLNYVHGYTDSYVGPRTQDIDPADLQLAVQTVFPALVSAFETISVPQRSAQP